MTVVAYNVLQKILENTTFYLCTSINQGNQSMKEEGTNIWFLLVWFYRPLFSNKIGFSLLPKHFISEGSAKKEIDQEFTF